MAGLSAITLFSLYTKHAMRNARLDELQAGIKTGNRNISNLRHGNGPTLMVEIEEELKSLLMTVKEGNERSYLKLNIENNNNKIMALLHDKEGGNVEVVTNFLFLGSKITADVDCGHEIRRRLLLGRKVMTNIDSVLKSRDITLPTKVHIVKAMVFPLVMYNCDSWTVKKAEC